MKVKVTLFVLFLFIGSMGYSQPWMEYVDDEKQTKGDASFFDIQKAFKEYTDEHNVENGYVIKNGEKQRFGGWKQYKRWEHFWEIRVNRETGAFPTKTPFKVYKKYLKNKKKLKFKDNSNWTNLGTDSSDGGYHGIGRLNCIEFHPTDDSTFWVGSPSGGLWKTTNLGETWVSNTDSNPVLGVSDIAIPSDYDTSTTIYIATGDRDAGDNYSTGILKSTDGGKTWQESYSMDVANRDLVNHLLIHPDDDSTIYAPTTEGLIKTSDAGNTWEKISDVQLKDMEFKPGNTRIMYGSTVGNPTKIYKSNDSGKSWVESLSVTGRRTEITVSPDDPKLVYAVVANTSNGLEGIYRSEDSGESFSKIYSEKNMLGWEADGSDNGGQGWYDLTIEADPNHADTLFVGGVNTWRSIDGGESWQIVNHWWGDGVPAAHADKHAMEFQNDTSIFFEGNDGGIYRSVDNGNTWEDLTNGMVISQIYKLSTAQSDTDIVINGLQDNGTKLYDKGEWYDVMGGDGMKCMIDHSNADIQYGTSYYGKISRTMDMWTSSEEITPSNASSGAWVTPFAMHPDNPEIIYGGYSDLWKSSNRGDSWTKISNISSGDKLRSIAISESDPEYIYVADLSNIWRTTNGGSSWTQITNSLPVTSSNAITNIEVDLMNPDIVWVTMGGYNDNNIYKTTDGGNSWSNISTGLPSLPVLDVIQDNSYTNKTVLYAGADVGVYKKVDDSDWKTFSNNLPNVIINDLDIYYNQEEGTNVLRAATYGRGLWETPITNENYVENPTLVQKEAFPDRAEIEWSNNKSNDTILLASSKDGSFSFPSLDANYNEVDTLPEGASVLYFGGSKNSFTHESLNPNTEYSYKMWSYDGINFSNGVKFSLKTTCDTPLTQVSNIQFDNKSGNSVDISWDRGDGDGVFVLAKVYDYVNEDPVCGEDYSTSLKFGEGENLDYGNYAVYKGDKNSISIEKLKSSTQYYFAFYEYNASDNCYLFPAETADVRTKSATTIGSKEKDKTFNIYPNPADESIEIIAPNAGVSANLEIVDLSGKTMVKRQINENEYSIDIRNLDAGTYIVKIYHSDSTFKEKLIVE
jgi:photosystem II stability/assembly factor-like uncharacterized protein